MKRRTFAAVWLAAAAFGAVTSADGELNWHDQLIWQCRHY